MEIFTIKKIKILFSKFFLMTMNSCWPENTPKLYSPIGGDDENDDSVGNGGTTTVSAVQKSSSRLSTEFTLGAGVSHLFTEEGLRYYYHHTNTNTTNDTTNTSNTKEEQNKKKYYTPSAIQFMNHHQLSELKISPRSITMEGLVPGDSNDDNKTTTNSATNPTSPMFLESVLLLTDAPHTLRFFLYDNGAGVEINGLNCAREGVVLTSGVMFKPGKRGHQQIRFPHARSSSATTVQTHGIMEDSLPLHFDPQAPVLHRMEVQSCTYLDPENDYKTIQKRVTYLHVETTAASSLSSSSSSTRKHSSITFGSKHAPGFAVAASSEDKDAANPENGNGVIYSDVESVAESHYVITGIGYNSKNRPITFQVVDLGRRSRNTNSPETMMDMMKACVYYGNGVISGNYVRDVQQLKDVEYGNSIIMEDGTILWTTVIQHCLNAISRSNPSCGELLPNTVDYFERSLAGDMRAIHTIFRFDRYLSYIIQHRQPIVALNYTKCCTGGSGGGGEQKQQHEWNHYSKLIPMKQMWSVFANTIERIKCIHSSQPGLNSFNAAFLEDSDDQFHQAVLIFGTQAIILLLTMSHVWENRKDVFAKFNLLRWSVSICGTLIVRYRCRQTRDNFFDFATIFPEYKSENARKHFILYCLDRLANCLAGRLVTLSTFFLLFMTNNNLDLVLNATALLFVMELDALTVDSSNPIWVQSVYRKFFMQDIINEFKKSNFHYWDPHYLKHESNDDDDGDHNNVGYRIHTDSCSFLFPKDQ